MLRRSALLAFCVCLTLVQGCRHQSVSPSNLMLAHEISPYPPRVGQVTITFRLTDASGTAVTGARISLEGSMSHAGMDYVLADARETEAGRYQSSMELSMAGDWHVLVHMILPDGRMLDRQLEIKEVKL